MKSSTLYWIAVALVTVTSTKALLKGTNWFDGTLTLTSVLMVALATYRGAWRR